MHESIADAACRLGSACEGQATAGEGEHLGSHKHRKRYLFRRTFEEDVGAERRSIVSLYLRITRDFFGSHAACSRGDRARKFIERPESHKILPDTQPNDLKTEPPCFDFRYQLHHEKSSL
jgi:hypothetical protein